MTSQEFNKLANLTQIFALSLGLVLCWGLPSCTMAGLSEPQVQQPSEESVRLLAELARADIVYLGEDHDRAAAHQAQLEIIQALYQKRGKIAIAMEMFQRPFQPSLDRYLAGEISEAQLKQESEYDDRWGFDWEFYAPILRFARTHQIPVIALNAPTEVTRKVAREGLDGLTPQDWRYIPPRSEIRTDNTAYRQLLWDIYQQHAHHGQGNSDRFERFLTAQVLWDETMAAAIAQFWQLNRQSQVIVLTGKGHIMYGHGIPSRVERRLQGQPLVQRSVWLGSFPAGEEPPADYSWPLPL